MLSKKLVFILFLILLTILVGVSFLYFKFKHDQNQLPVGIYSLTSTSTPDSIKFLFQDGYQLGEVKLTNQDLEKEFKLMFEYTPQNINNIENWVKAIQSLNDKAIIQNEGIQSGLFTETNFSPKRVNEAKEYIEKQGKTYVSGEFISIWFLNVNEPSVGLETAKGIAYKKINSLRERIVSEAITMQQAGEEIRNDTSLVSIDGAYESNAYRKFESIGKDQPIFTDTAIDEQMWKLKIGDTSNILTAKDYNENGPYEAYYIFIKITDKKISEYKSLDDLIKIRKAQGLEINIDNIK